jgi:hypothetical protein
MLHTPQQNFTEHHGPKLWAREVSITIHFHTNLMVIYQVKTPAVNEPTKQMRQSLSTMLKCYIVAKDTTKLL